MVIGAIPAVGGGLQIFQGTTDYSDHTARAEATVVEREVAVSASGPGEPAVEEITVYVDYRAEGAEHDRVELAGLGADAYQEGDRLTVAYAPGEPGHAATPRSTGAWAYSWRLLLGAASVLAGLGAVAAGAVLLRGASRTERRGP
ncbi:hypothetical protein GCM10023224_07250 [Streptomonospora halophila]|uniref:DUF3592 domain-containing protein n=1 Tax=Streptomonospora halophila TaxID=427369 RepID=A0ABP9G665_9ACTN